MIVTVTQAAGCHGAMVAVPGQPEPDSDRNLRRLPVSLRQRGGEWSEEERRREEEEEMRRGGSAAAELRPILRRSAIKRYQDAA